MGSVTSKRKERTIVPGGMDNEDDLEKKIKELEASQAQFEQSAHSAEELLRERNAALQRLQGSLEYEKQQNTTLRLELSKLQEKEEVYQRESMKNEGRKLRLNSRSRRSSSLDKLSGSNDVLPSHISIVNRDPARVARTLREYKKRDAKDCIVTSLSSLTPDKSDIMVRLPRGGIYVWTKAGPVQFGIPPETLKDSIQRGLEVPTIFVVPRERFNIKEGINVSEIEFPAFFNFFVRKKKAQLITYPECEKYLYTIMKEALDGPDEDQLYIKEEYSQFASEELIDRRPDHIKEIAYFREPRPGTATIEVSNLISFSFFDANGECHLSEDVVIKDETYGYTVFQDGEPIVLVSDEDAKSCRLPLKKNIKKEVPKKEEEKEKGDDEEEEEKKEDEVGVEKQENGDAATGEHGGEGEEEKAKNKPSTGPEPPPSEPFRIPKFGITVLGNSHGFDPLGDTSGFVIWINGQGIMVDPPPHSTALLLNSAIHPKSITGVILTHCHADHDAGTMQKIITEDKIHLMTTKTIFESLIRKYAGVSGLAPELLKQLVNFRPVFIDEPTYWGAACFRFFYSLHAIPCVGLEVSFQGKSLVYSADTFYHPEGLAKLRDRGILSEGRLNALLGFPWECDLVLHEAGVPPIHTPIEAFELLPPEHQKNIQLIHIGGKEKKAAMEKGFKIVKTGVENTVVLLEAQPNENDTLAFLQLIAAVDIFKSFPIPRTLDLLLMSERRFYRRQTQIAREGTAGDRFLIIMEGTASVTVFGNKKLFLPGDYLGEISVMTNAKRTATIVAETDVVTVEIDKYAFSYFLRTDRTLCARMENLKKARRDESWAAIARNSVLRTLSASQKTSMQALFKRKITQQDQVIWKAGEQARFAVLIADGSFAFEEIHFTDPYELLTATQHAFKSPQEKEQNQFVFDNLTTGAFICDRYALVTDMPMTMTLVCVSNTGCILTLEKDHILNFLENSPITLLALMTDMVLL